MSSPVKMVPVRFANESLRSPAKNFMHPDSAKEMVESGLAEWKKNSLILKRRSPSMWATGRSLKPDFRVMYDFACGKRYAIAIVEKWAFGA